MKFLKFNTEAEAVAAFAPWASEGVPFPAYVGAVAVDPVGVIQKPTGVTLQDAECNEYPEMAPIQGWHINLSDSVPELAAFEIEAPASPTRAFAGAWPSTEPVERVIARVQQAVQQRLDDFARTRAYDGILSACTYATSAVPKFAAEGQYAVQARDASWAACYQVMADVQAGRRSMPSVEQVLAELPALAWPQ